MSASSILRDSKLHNSKFQQLIEFKRKYQIVLSGCRLLTEAQSALDRSIKEFVNAAENFDTEPTTQGSQPAEHRDSRDVNETEPGQVAPIDQPVQPEVNVPTKKDKKVKDPDLPKRPTSAFFRFQNAMRDSVKATLPEETTGAEIQKAVSEKWKTLDEAGRKPWNDQHEKETADYENKIAIYRKERGIKTKAKSSSRKVLSDPTEVASDRSLSSDDDAAAASLVQPKTTNSKAPEGEKGVKKRSRKSELSGSKKVKSFQPLEENPEKKKKRKKSDAARKSLT